MRPSHPHARSLVAVGIPALVVTLGVGGALVMAPRRDGPLVATSTLSVEFELPPGRAGTWGIVLPTNPTLSDITIQAVETVDARGVHVVGMLVNDPEQNGGVGTLDVYPPPGVRGYPVAGAVLPAIGSDAPFRQLLIGVRLSEAAEGVIGALRVRYRHAGASYEASLPYILHLRRSEP